MSVEKVFRVRDSRDSSSDKAPFAVTHVFPSPIVNQTPILESEEGNAASMTCAAAHVSEEYYAMMDSGTNAIIIPLHPEMCGAPEK